jgi:hypothetical protein
MFTLLQVASYMRAVLRTLAQCHRHCILHRDITCPLSNSTILLHSQFAGIHVQRAVLQINEHQREVQQLFVT